MTEKEKTEEEKTKEANRKFYKEMLQDNELRSIYATSIASQMGYGSEAEKALGEHAYNPSFWNAEAYDENGEKYNIAKSQLEQSRENGKPGTGYVAEQKVMEEVQKHMNKSLQYITYEDLLELTGNKKAKEKLKEEYKGKTLGGMLPSQEEYKQIEEEMKKAEESGNEEEMQRVNGKYMMNIKGKEREYQEIASYFQQYAVQSKLQESLGSAQKETAGNLEKKLCN